MRGSSAVTIAAATVVGLVLVKNGMIGKMINDGAAFLRDTASGLKPITGIA